MSQVKLNPHKNSSKKKTTETLFGGENTCANFLRWVKPLCHPENRYKYWQIIIFFFLLLMFVTEFNKVKSTHTHSKAYSKTMIEQPVMSWYRYRPIWSTSVQFCISFKS